jgi:tRNA-modifying protein YgfZ
VGTCELIWVEGPDAQSFLHGLLTNDIAALAPGASCRTLLLDNTGHIQSDMRALRTGDTEFTLITDEQVGQPLVDRLEQFHFSEEVEILGPELSACVTLMGAVAGEIAGVDLMLPGMVTGTVDAIGPDAAAIFALNNLTVGDPDLFEAGRIRAGVPRFLVDFTSANLVQEAGLEQAVSFDKGCYLGQETVARLHYRGRANRRLCGVLLDAPAAVGSELLLASRSVGALTSLARDPALGLIGLAVLRREVAAGEQLYVDGSSARARVKDLPFTERS